MPYIIIINKKINKIVIHNLSINVNILEELLR